MSQQLRCTECGTCTTGALELVPGRLWIGGIAALDDSALLRRVDAVITAFPPYHHGEVDELALSRKLEGKARLRVPIEDSPSAPIERYFEPVARWIDAHEAVLLHCFRGHGRSVTLAAYYLATRLGEREPLERLFALDPCINPNFTFRRKLTDAIAAYYLQHGK
jgi:hypothetical protein